MLIYLCLVISSNPKQNINLSLLCLYWKEKGNLRKNIQNFNSLKEVKEIFYFEPL